MTAQLAFGFGPWEMWVILLIALLLFGHRIPGMARSLGSGIVEFKRGLKGGSDSSSGAVTSGSTPGQPAPPPEESTQQDELKRSPTDQGSADN